MKAVIKLKRPMFQARDKLSSQTSKMESFATMHTDFKQLFIVANLSILDIFKSPEYTAKHIPG